LRGIDQIQTMFDALNPHFQGIKTMLKAGEITAQASEFPPETRSVAIPLRKPGHASRSACPSYDFAADRNGVNIQASD
jgi:hypothetical protein